MYSCNGSSTQPAAAAAPLKPTAQHDTATADTGAVFLQFEGAGTPDGAIPLEDGRPRAVRRALQSGGATYHLATGQRGDSAYVMLLRDGETLWTRALAAADFRQFVAAADLPQLRPRRPEVVCADPDLQVFVLQLVLDNAQVRAAGYNLLLAFDLQGNRTLTRDIALNEPVFATSDGRTLLTQEGTYNRLALRRFPRPLPEAVRLLDDSTFVAAYPGAGQLALVRLADGRELQRLPFSGPVCTLGCAITAQANAKAGQTAILDVAAKRLYVYQHAQQRMDSLALSRLQRLPQPPPAQAAAFRLVAAATPDHYLFRSADGRLDSYYLAPTSGTGR